ncbi:HNH endonuclease [Cereibacter sphaeroides]|nr:HNH endonuclease [Cereibacter sphaeroides]
MRVIDLNDVCLPEGWIERANSAKAAGQDFISSHASVWQDCKEPLKKASYKKCFYCEITQSRSDNAVDHFRPKSKYPWHAFDLQNFRFACTYCNSRRKDIESGRTGGKGDLFPLFNEERRASCLEDQENERPILIDPCAASEPMLIDFDSDGTPRPAYKEEDHAGRYRRAVVSINLYHLDHPDAVEMRRKLALTIVKEVRTANRLFPYTEAGNAAIDESFDQHLRNLAAMLKPEAQLSVFARRVLEGYRSVAWVPGILATA